MSQAPDPLDRASELEQLRAEFLIQQAQLKAKPEQVQNANGDWPEPDCRNCDLPIEEGRLALGKVRCFSCQNAKERREKGFL